MRAHRLHPSAATWSQDPTIFSSISSTAPLLKECSPESIQLKSPTPSLHSLSSNWRLLDCVIPTSSDFFALTNSPSPSGKHPSNKLPVPASCPCIQNWLSANKGDSSIHCPSDFCKSHGQCLAYHFRAPCLYLPTLVEPKAHDLLPQAIPHCIAVAPSSSPLSSSCFLTLRSLFLSLLFPYSHPLSHPRFDWSCLSLLTFHRQFLLSSHVRKVDPRGRWQGHPQLPPYQSSRHQAHSSPCCCQPQPSRQALLPLLRRGCFPQGRP